MDIIKTERGVRAVSDDRFLKKNNKKMVGTFSLGFIFFIGFMYLDKP
jgi:hypothetical protein